MASGPVRAPSCGADLWSVRSDAQGSAGPGQEQGLRIGARGGEGVLSRRSRVFASMALTATSLILDERMTSAKYEWCNKNEQRCICTEPRAGEAALPWCRWPTPTRARANRGFYSSFGGTLTMCGTLQTNKRKPWVSPRFRPQLALTCAGGPGRPPPLTSSHSASSRPCPPRRSRSAWRPTGPRTALPARPRSARYVQATPSSWECRPWCTSGGARTRLRRWKREYVAVAR